MVMSATVTIPAQLTSKTFFLALKAETGFLKLKRKSSPVNGLSRQMDLAFCRFSSRPKYIIGRGMVWDISSDIGPCFP
jgi:hypothetical protein